MSVFTNLPIRLNGGAGGKIYASWWNDIRTALISAFGSYVTPETQILILDNQAAWVDTGLVLDQTKIRASRIEYSMYRTDGGATERREMGFLTALYKPVLGAWVYFRQSYGDDDALGDTGDMRIEPGTGKLQYKSDSVGGAYVGKMRYKSMINFEKEV